MRRRIFVLFISIILFGALFTAGCSEEKGDSLERVKKEGELSFAMSGGYPPFNFYNNKNELVGFDVDVCKEVAKRLGVKEDLITTEWSGIIEGLRSGAYDTILGSMAVTDKRKEVVNFSEPYYYSGAQVVVKKGHSFTDVQDLKGKIIGVVIGTTFEKDAQELGAADVKLYKDDNQTLLELNNGSIDAVITDRVVGVNAVNGDNFGVELLGSPLRSEDIAVAIRKGDDSLLQAVNKIIEEMHEDGTLSQLSEKWLKTDITKK